MCLCLGTKKKKKIKEMGIEILLWQIYPSEIRLGLETALCKNLFLASFS